MKPFSENIKKARKQKGWSQEQTSRFLRVGRPRYGAWEEGRGNPPWEMMPVIMEVFEIKEQDMYPFIFNEEFFKKNTY